MIRNQSQSIANLKKKCLELYDFKDDFAEYQKEFSKVQRKVTELNLTNIVDPTHLAFHFMVVIGKKIKEMSFEDFQKKVNEFLSVKKRDFYFQLIELREFPENYPLGYGNLISFKELPDPVKKIATKLSKGETDNIYNNKQSEQVFECACKQILIPEDPKKGFWLKISPPMAITFNIMVETAFVYADDSLDILRIVKPARGRTRLPQIAIEYNSQDDTAFPVWQGIEFGKYSYDPNSDALIQRLNHLCVNPSCELEERIKDSLHFFRMGEIHAPRHQQLFFYVAAIERLILSPEPNLNHKFCERAAILLEKKSEDRIAKLDELKKLYQMRSIIAHGKKSDYDFHTTFCARSYLRAIILKIMYLIDSEKITRVAPKKELKNESLQEYINRIIFSG